MSNQVNSVPTVPPAVQVLSECMDLMVKKANDYQNPNSSIKQAMHYRRGIDTIHDMIAQKLLRAQSLIESGNIPNNESLEDTYKDMINYCAFAVTYLRGKMDGQSPNRDEFNRPKISPGVSVRDMSYTLKDVGDLHNYRQTPSCSGDTR